MTAKAVIFFQDVRLLPQGAQQVGVGAGVVDGQTGDQARLIVQDLGVLLSLLRLHDAGRLEGQERRVIHVDLQDALGLHVQVGLHGGEVLLHLEAEALARRQADGKELLMFYSSTEKKLTTLKEYVSRMKEDQKCIYYAAGESVAAVDKLPQTDCKPKFLDEKLLDQPVAAMYLLSQEIGHCADMASDMLNTAKAALHGKAEDFHTYEVESNQVRNLRNDINDYTAKLLSSGVLTESQSEQTAGLLYVSNNIDRMTEYSQRVTQTVQQVYQSGRKLSASAEQELNECYDTAHDLFDRAVDSVRYGDADMAQQVLADKKKLRKAQKRFNKAHMARVKAGKCESNLTADFSAILYGLERMVDNSVNIAEETLDSIHFVELEPAQMEALSDRGIPVPVPAQ